MNRPATRQGRKSSDRRPAIAKGGLPALLAVGGSLAATPAAAFELGELTVQSGLGQPLRASIAYVLAPNEQLSRYCITLQPVAGGSGLPAVTGTDVSLANGVISLTGDSPIREPLMSARVVIDCPYTPHLSREYLLFIDPPEEVAPLVSREPAVAPVEPAREAAPAPARAATLPRPDAAPIAQGARYRVQPGDSLSEIAARLENRHIGLWPAVTAIFDANPHAFIDSDPNKLRAGSWLDIPAMTASGVAARFAADDPAPAPETAAAVEAPTTATVYSGAESLQPVSLPEVPAETVTGTPESASEPAADSVNPYSEFSDLRPGDVVVSDGVPAEDSSIVIPDTAIEAPEITAREPNQTTASIVTAGADDAASRGWLYWLAGSGVALIGGLLLFGRRIRQRFGSTPIAVAPQHPMRRATDHGETATVESLAIPDTGMDIEPGEPYADVDFDLSDDSPTEENLALDADLVMGTGFAQGTDMDVNQDFGFAVTTELDMVLPEHTGDDQEEHGTDIIPPPDRTGTSAILESEVLPEDDDYDMSVIVDATKMPDPDDVTERDLKAVPVGEDDQRSLVASDYTISKEVDYEILEQDYEDEMTATQALNMEIEKAAAQLAERMDETEGSSTRIKLATVTELDVSADEEAGNDDDGDITANMEAEDKTVNMPADDEDATKEMATDSDHTAEMEIESGKVDTRTG